MKRILAACVLFLLLAPAPSMAASPTFSASGFDARSLGRGGTNIAAAGGASSIFGNPATLLPSGSFMLGAESVRARDFAGSWAFYAVDGRSLIRGGAAYLNRPDFTGFDDRLWGVAFSQSVGSFLVIGESYHRGRFQEAGAPKEISAGDLGLLLSPVGRVTIGFVSRGVYRSNRENSLSWSGYGVNILLPWTISLSADLEEAPLLPGENGVRAGLEAAPFEALDVRAGWQRAAGGGKAWTLGLTWHDVSGTLDGGVSWDPDARRMKKAALGFTVEL